MEGPPGAPPAFGLDAGRALALVAAIALVAARRAALNASSLASLSASSASISRGGCPRSYSEMSAAACLRDTITSSRERAEIANREGREVGARGPKPRREADITEHGREGATVVVARGRRRWPPDKRGGC